MFCRRTGPSGAGAGCTPPLPRPTPSGARPLTSQRRGRGSEPSQRGSALAARQRGTVRRHWRPDVTAHEPPPKRLGRFQGAGAGPSMRPHPPATGHACPQVPGPPHSQLEIRPNYHASSSLAPHAPEKSLRLSGAPSSQATTSIHHCGSRRTMLPCGQVPPKARQDPHTGVRES